MSFRKRTEKVGVSVLALSLSLSPLLTPKVHAQSAGRPGATATTGNFANANLTNLDLSSSSAAVSTKNTTPVNIVVGGSMQHGAVAGGTALTILPGQLVTPAQYLAVLGAMSGQQTLLLNNQGAAFGGTTNLRSSSLQNLTGLTVPAGVSLHAIGYNANTPLNVAGAVNIAGAMYNLQTAPNVMAVLNMVNLNVAPGGLLTSNLPTGMSMPGVFGSSGMQLNVSGNVVNQGTISSTGDVNISALGSVTNQSVSSAALISGQNVNLSIGSGSLVNSGLIQAVQSLNINSPSSSTDISINNTNGMLSALGAGGIQGIINIREDGAALELANVRVVGGELSAANGINVYGKNMDVNVDTISGAISNKGSTAHVSVSSGNLVLGDQTLSGDPTYFNNAGDVTVGNITAASDVAVVASGNVTLNGDIQITQPDSSILVMSGADFTTNGAGTGSNDTTTTLTFTGSVNFGKSITMTSTGGSLSTQGSGRITLAATGPINFGANTMSSESGDITIIARDGFFQSGGAITTNGQNLGEGNVNIQTAEVNIQAGSTILNGTPSALPSAGVLRTLPATLSDINAPNGAVSISAGNQVSLNGNITAGSSVSVSADSGALNLNGAITGASVSLVTGQKFTNIMFDTFAGQIKATSGDVNFASSTGNVISIGSDINVVAVGGSVNFNLDGGFITMAGSGAKSINIQGDNGIDLRAGGTKVAANILSDGANVQLVSANGSVLGVGLIRTDNLSGAGSITIAATKLISVGDLNASSTGGNGGDVSITTYDPSIGTLSVNGDIDNTGATGTASVTIDRSAISGGGLHIGGGATGSNYVSGVIKSSGTVGIKSSDVILHGGGDAITAAVIGINSNNGTGAVGSIDSSAQGEGGLNAPQVLLNAATGVGTNNYITLSNSDVKVTSFVSEGAVKLYSKSGDITSSSVDLPGIGTSSGIFTATGSITILNSAGAINIDLSDAIKTLDGNITLQSNSFGAWPNFEAVSAGTTGTVQILPAASNQDIVVGGSYFSSSNLFLIRAQNLIFGASSGFTGKISLGSNINAGAVNAGQLQGAYNISFLTGSLFDAVGHNIGVGNNSLSIVADAGVTFASINSKNGAVNISSPAGFLSQTAPVSATGSGSFNLSAFGNIDGAAAINSVNGNITINILPGSVSGQITESGGITAGNVFIGTSDGKTSNAFGVTLKNTVQGGSSVVVMTNSGSLATADLQSKSGSILLTNFGGKIDAGNLTAGTSVTVNAKTNVNIGKVIATNDVSMQVGKTLTFIGDVTSTAGKIETVSGLFTGSVTPVSITAAGDLKLTANGAGMFGLGKLTGGGKGTTVSLQAFGFLTGDIVNTGGNVSVICTNQSSQITTGAINTSSLVDDGGSVTLAGGNNITVNGSINTSSPSHGGAVLLSVNNVDGGGTSEEDGYITVNGDINTTGKFGGAISVLANRAATQFSVVTLQKLDSSGSSSPGAVNVSASNLIGPLYVGGTGLPGFSSVLQITATGDNSSSVSLSNQVGGITLVGKSSTSVLADGQITLTTSGFSSLIGAGAGNGVLSSGKGIQINGPMNVGDDGSPGFPHANQALAIDTPLLTITSITGAVNVVSNSGQPLGLASMKAIGPILVQSDSSIVVQGKIESTTNNVTLSSLNGDISQASSAGIWGTTVILSAKGNIGTNLSGSQIYVAATKLTAASASGAVFIEELSGNLELVGKNTAPTGFNLLSQVGDITLGAGSFANIGSLLIDVSNSGSNLIITAPFSTISTTSGSIVLQVNNQIIAPAGDVSFISADGTNISASILDLSASKTFSISSPAGIILGNTKVVSPSVGLTLDASGGANKGFISGITDLVTGGAPITLKAGSLIDGNISLGKLDSSSSSGNGADITLDAGGDVSVASVDASGVQGGNVLIGVNVQPNSFKTTQNGVNSSSNSNVGGGNGGSITIQVLNDISITGSIGASSLSPLTDAGAISLVSANASSGVFDSFSISSMGPSHGGQIELNGFKSITVFGGILTVSGGSAGAVFIDSDNVQDSILNISGIIDTSGSNSGGDLSIQMGGSAGSTNSMVRVDQGINIGSNGTGGKLFISVPNSTVPLTIYADTVHSGSNVIGPISAVNGTGPNSISIGNSVGDIQFNGAGDSIVTGGGVTILAPGGKSNIIGFGAGQGNIKASIITFVAGGQVGAPGAELSTTTASINAKANSGDLGIVNSGASSVLTLAASATGSLKVVTDGGFDLTGAIKAGSVELQSTGANAPINLAPLFSGITASSGDVHLTANGGGISSSGPALTITAAGQVVLSLNTALNPGNINVGAAPVSISGTSVDLLGTGKTVADVTGSSVTLKASSSTLSSFGKINASDSIYLYGATGVTLNSNLTASNNVEIYSDSGAINGSGASLKSAAASIFVDPGSGQVTGLKDIFAADSIYLGSKNSASPSSDSVSVTGKIDASKLFVYLSKGSISLSGPVTLTSPSDVSVLNAGTGSINLPTGITTIAGVKLLGQGDLSVGGTISGASIELAATNVTSALSTQTSNLVFNINGGLTVDNTSAGSLSLTDSFADGKFVLNNSGTGVSTKNVTVVGASISLSAGATLDVDDLDSDGTVMQLVTDAIGTFKAINAGSAQLTIRPVTDSTDITIGTAASGLVLSSSQLAGIVAGTVTIGSSSGTGVTTINSDLDISGSSLSKIEFLQNPSSSLSFKGQTLNLGPKSLNIQGGALKLGIIVSSGSTINIDGGSIEFNGDIGSSKDITSISSGASIVTNSYKISASDLTLTAKNGIVFVNTLVAGKIQASASGAPQNIAIFNTGNLQLNIPAAVSGPISVQNQGSLSLLSAVEGNAVTLTSTGAVSSFTNNANQIKANVSDVSLTADSVVLTGSNYISATKGAVLIAPSNASTHISLGGSKGLVISQSNLDNISTTSLTIGGPAYTGGISLDSKIDVSKLYSLVLKQGSGDVDFSLNTFVVGDKKLTIESKGIVTLGTVTSSGGTISATGGTVLVNGNIGDVNAIVSLTSTDGLIKTSKSVITANQLTLSGSGDDIIVTTASGNIVASLNTTEDSIDITNTGNLLLKGTSSGGAIGLTNTGNLTLSDDAIAEASIAFTLDAGSTFDNAGFMLKSSNGILNITADKLVLTGSKIIEAPTSAAIFQPVTSNIGFVLGGSKSGSLNFTPAILDAFNLASLQLGNSSLSGGAELASALNISKSYDVSILQGSGSYDSKGFAVTMIGGLNVTSNSGNIASNSVAMSGAKSALVLQTGSGSITLNASSVMDSHDIKYSTSSTISGLTLSTMSPRRESGNGGNLFLKASNLPSNNLALDVSGDTGDGGNLTYIRTATSALNLNSSANFKLNISGINAGSATISNGGDLVFDTAAGILNDGTTKDGASIFLEAGAGGPGKLQVLGSISANAKAGSGGKGGHISLTSNSSTAFLLASSSTKNGTTGTITVAGDGAASNGIIDIANKGGALTTGTVQDLSKVSLLSLSTGGTGALTVSKSVGGAGTQSVSIIAGGALSTGKSIITGQSAELRSGTGGFSSQLNSVALVTAVGGGKGAVSLTNNGTGDIKVAFVNSGAAFSLIQNAGDVSFSDATVTAATTIDIKATKADSKIVIGSGAITSGTSITLTATGKGSIDYAPGEFAEIKSKTVTFVSGSGNVGSPGPGIFTNASSLALNTTGSAYVSNTNTGLLTLSSAKTGAGQNLQIDTDGGLTVTASVTAPADISLTSAGVTTLNGSLGNVTGTNSIKIVSTNNLLGAGTLSTNGSKGVQLQVSGNVGTSSVPVKVNTPLLAVSAASLLNLSNANKGSSTVSALTSSSSLGYASSGPTTFAGALNAGTSMTLKLAGTTTVSGKLDASTGALTLNQTGTGSSTTVSGSVNAGASLTITTPGALNTGNISSSSTLKLTAGGNYTLGTVSSSKDITISQTAVSSSTSFGDITGTVVAVNLKPTTSGTIAFNKVTASSGALKIAESGSSSGLTSMSDISAKAAVNVSTLGASNMGSVIAGANSGNGAVNITTKGTTVLGKVDANGSSGTVSIAQTGGNTLTLEGGTAIGASYTVKSSGVGGIISTGGIGNLTAIKASSTVSILNLAPASSNASVGLNGSVIADANKGTITITAVGSGSISQEITGTSISAKTVVLNSGASNGGTIGTTLAPVKVNATSLSLNTSGAVSVSALNPATTTVTVANTNGSSFALDAAGALTMTATLSNAKSITLSSVGNMALNGSSLGSTAKTSGAISLSTQSGNITGNATVSSSNSVSLQSVSGSIGSSTTVLKVNTPSVTKAVTGNASGAELINLSNTSSVAASYGPMSAGGSITVSAANASTFNGAITSKAGTTGSGNIKIVQNAGLLTVAAGVTIHAEGKTAQITIQEKGNSATIVDGITLGTGSKLETIATTTKPSTTSFPKLGQISVIVGSSIPTPSNGPAILPNPPAGIVIGTGDSPNVFFGTTNNFVTTGTTNIDTVGETAVQFQAGTNAAISLDAVTIVADPPVVSAAPILLSGRAAQKAQFVTPTQVGAGGGAISISHVRTNSLETSLAASNIVNVSLMNAGQNSSVLPGSSSATTGSVSTVESLGLAAPGGRHSTIGKSGILQGAVSTNSRMFSSQFEDEYVHSALSESDSMQVLSDRPLGLRRLSESRLSESRLSQSGFADGTRKQVVIENQSLLLAPFSNTTVKTKFGEIDVDARSMVLVFSSPKGTSIFNLDDQHRNSVIVRTASNHKFVLSAGKHITLTDVGARGFEQINPVESIAYRNINQQSLANGHMVFTSEFSIPSAINSINVLKELCKSKNQESMRLRNHLMKTLAAMVQMNKSGVPYQQVLTPRLAAFKN